MMTPGDDAGRDEGVSPAELCAAEHCRNARVALGQYCEAHTRDDGGVRRGKPKPYPLEEDARLELLYRMARHLRNTDDVKYPGTYARMSVDLLAELRGIDPDRYDREVKHGK